MEKSLLIKALSLTVGSLVSLCMANTSLANPDLSRLEFHPTTLDSARLESVASYSATITSLVNRNADAANETPQMPEAAIEAYQQQIINTENKLGPYGFGLAEQSLALANLLQNSNQHAAALSALEKGLHIQRVNTGLYDISQEEILLSMIESYLALGDLEQASNKKEVLFNIQRRAYSKSDPAFASALIDWADWNVNMYLQTGNQPGYSVTNDNPSGATARLDSPQLNLAHGYYYEAINLLHEHSSLADERLAITEQKLAALNFIVNQKVNNLYQQLPASLSQGTNFNKNRRTIDQANAAHFFNGSDALKRAIAYSYNSPEAEYGTIAERIMELGDWYLLFDRRAAALDIYEEAYEVLAAAALPQNEIDRILSPGMPVQTPVDTYQNVFASNAEQYNGFIDVEFNVSKFGIPSNPEIIGASDNMEAIEKQLIRTIRNHKFRPDISQGKVSSKKKVQLRYYYSY